MASSGNFMSFNPLVRRASSYTDLGLSHSNLRLTYKVGNGSMGNFGFKLGDGKFYFEIYIIRQNSAVGIGIMKSSVDMNNYTTQGPVAVYRQEGRSNVSANSGTGAPTANSSYGENMVADDIVGCAVDFTNSTINWYRNNSAQGAIDISGMNDGTEYLPIVYGSNSDIHLNCGQDSTFAGLTSAGGNADDNGFGDFKYSPPSGYLAMCSANLPIESGLDPAQTDDDHPQKLFGQLSYTGNGGANTVNGLGFKPDLVWGISISSGQSKRVLDSSRGGNNYVYLDQNSAQVAGSASGDTVEFLDDGIKWNNTNGNNDNTVTYVAACWRANGGTTASNTSGTITTTVQTDPNQSFSIVTYSGTGTNATIGHGLSAAPDTIWWKNLSQNDSWAVYNSGDLLGNNKLTAVDVNLGSSLSGTAYMQATNPTSTVISIGDEHKVNASGENYVAYCWRNVDGFQKFGTFKGNANTNGAFVYLGFRPTFLINCSLRFGGTPHWESYNSVSNTLNPAIYYSTLDDGNQTYSATSRAIDFLSNGFKIRNSDVDSNSTSGQAFYCWGDVPFKYGNTF